ncbi:hypothetical protein EV360DRAFT_86044 [Lentinula raphanica]|nr:hypothetical protein EV360DRAFT_86044 [Lentinula raphanica]
MRLSTLVIVLVIASAACAMPVRIVPRGQGDSSLASSEGETSQVLSGTLYPRESLPLPNGQSTVSNGLTIIEDFAFCKGAPREGNNLPKDTSAQDPSADKFAHWLVEYAMTRFYKRSSPTLPKDSKNTVQMDKKVHYPFTFQEMAEQGGVFVSITDISKS